MPCFVRSGRMIASQPQAAPVQPGPISVWPTGRGPPGGSGGSGDTDRLPGTPQSSIPPFPRPSRPGRSWRGLAYAFVLPAWPMRLRAFYGPLARRSIGGACWHGLAWGLGCLSLDRRSARHARACQSAAPMIQPVPAARLGGGRASQARARAPTSTWAASSRSRRRSSGRWRTRLISSWPDQRYNRQA